MQHSLFSLYADEKELEIGDLTPTLTTDSGYGAWQERCSVPTNMWQSPTNEKESTLIRSAKRAVTIPDLTAFAASLELRPLAPNLRHLPEIARVSEAKFTVPSHGLAPRF